MESRFQIGLGVAVALLTLLVVWQNGRIDVLEARLDQLGASDARGHRSPPAAVTARRTEEVATRREEGGGRRDDEAREPRRERKANERAAALAREDQAADEAGEQTPDREGRSRRSPEGSARWMEEVRVVAGTFAAEEGLDSATTQEIIAIYQALADANRLAREDAAADQISRSDARNDILAARVDTYEQLIELVGQDRFERLRDRVSAIRGAP